MKTRRIAQLAAFSIASVAASVCNACPDGQYEMCIAAACVCMPKAGGRPDNATAKGEERVIGSETTDSIRLRTENAKLRELVWRLDQKVQLLESRIKDLETKK